MGASWMENFFQRIKLGKNIKKNTNFHHIAMLLN